MRRLLALALVLAGLLARVGPARAQAPAPVPASAPAEPEAGTQPAVAPEDPEQALFQRGSRDFDAGQFAAAAAAFEEAHQRFGKPIYLFNLAQARRLQHLCAPALAAYDRYLAESAPDDPRRSLAVKHRDQMQSCLRPPAPTPASASASTSMSAQAKVPSPVSPGLLDSHRPAPPPPPSPGRIWMRPAGLAAISLGAAAGLAGAYFLWDGHRIGEELNKPGMLIDPGQNRRGNRANAWATGLLIGAGLAGAAGTTFLLISPPDPPDGQSASALPLIGYAGRF